MITVYECGQGDSAFIQDLSLLVDLGEKQPNNLPNVSNIDLMISHSHDDHIFGIKLFNYNVNQLIVPAYLPECNTIISKLKNKNTYKCSNKLRLVCDGMLLYNGKVRILNPPVEPWNNWKKVEKVTDDQVNSFLIEIGLSREEIQNTLASLEYESEIPPIANYNRDLFVISMLKVIAYNYYSYQGNLSRAINSFVNDEANDLSIIFSYKADNNIIYLFTGDANKKQFERINLEDANALKCDVLKVPHHGSKNSLDQEIIGYMSPKIAIVSHNNRKFGNAKDSHPNQEILDLFENNKIPLFSTNDVLKEDKQNNTQKIVMAKYRGTIKGYDIAIV
ncbi:MAG: hypothetical protein J5527_09610 [Treponema sp.]|nr:hypothetical protein [Treponema sp.]